MDGVSFVNCSCPVKPNLPRPPGSWALEFAFSCLVVSAWGRKGAGAPVCLKPLISQGGGGRGKSRGMSETESTSTSFEQPSRVAADHLEELTP